MWTSSSGLFAAASRGKMPRAVSLRFWVMFSDFCFLLRVFVFRDFSRQAYRESTRRVTARTGPLSAAVRSLLPLKRLPLQSSRIFNHFLMKSRTRFILLFGLQMANLELFVRSTFCVKVRSFFAFLESKPSNFDVLFRLQGDEVLQGFPIEPFRLRIEFSRLRQSSSKLQFRRSIAPIISSSDSSLIF